MGQLVKLITLDPSSNLDLRFFNSSPLLGYMMGMKPTLKNKK